MSAYDLTQAIPAKFLAGDILNCPYSGAGKEIALAPGRYKLECWGAQGGYRSSSSYGGKGGYSAGTLSLGEETAAYLYAGGEGNTQTAGSSSSTEVSGGFNGGGSRARYQGGGGGSDIRIGQNSLYARVIVAGGGGSDGASGKTGMYGGGASGGTATQSYGTGGGGGTQTAGGSGGSDNAGSFGQGGKGLYRSSGYGGGGGGGWYGGGGSYPDSSGDDDRGGGGGSGFVWTGANAPAGYLLTEAHRLTDASTTAGNVSFTGPKGTAETGHSGNGYVRVTVLEIYKTAPDPPGNFRQTAQDYFSIGLAWDAPEDALGYKLYRDGVLLSTLTETAYMDTNVQPNSTYQYSVVAYNAEGDGDPAAVAAKTTEGWAMIQPVISAAVWSVNPADINTKTVLAVTVTDQLMILEPEIWYSGELYAGEV